LATSCSSFSSYLFRSGFSASCFRTFYPSGPFELVERGRSAELDSWVAVAPYTPGGEEATCPDVIRRCSGVGERDDKFPGVSDNVSVDGFLQGYNDEAASISIGSSESLRISEQCACSGLGTLINDCRASHSSVLGPALRKVSEHLHLNQSTYLSV
jgi:hypothetical protein